MAGRLWTSICSQDFKPTCVAHCPKCQKLSREQCCTNCGRRLGRGTAVTRNESAGLSVRWLHIPKCGSTLGISLLAYGCTPSHPPWHIVFLAIAGGSIDVRMAHAIDARHNTTGTRCDGRIVLPFNGHDPVRHEKELVTRPTGAIAHAAALTARQGAGAGRCRRGVGRHACCR
jgi:hypothetical protein